MSKGEGGSNQQDVVRHVEALLRERRIVEAERLCQQVLEKYPTNATGYILAARVAQQKNDAAKMEKLARRAVELAPTSKASRLTLAEAQILSGESIEALTALNDLEAEAERDIYLFQKIAEFHTQCGRHGDAARCLERALEIEPKNPQILYNLATAKIALGDMEGAEALLDRVIEHAPHDYDAYYNRATLRKQNASRNHVDAMEGVLEKGLKSPQGEVPLCYALAKELEDLEESEKAFAYLKRGADRRKQGLSYKVSDDVDTMKVIQKTFDDAFFARTEKGEEATTPLFIIGLPRSGTTLVDRILSSHSDVASLGEINDLVLSVMEVAGQAQNKTELIKKTAELDFSKLGQTYEARILAYGQSAKRLIDKTPANFLYMALIAKALPKASIVHLRRNPMDVCYAMYKTLFRMAYPFSYSLDDLADYYIAYHHLMQHWRDHLGERLLDIDYEALVQDQEGQTRRLLSHCNLPWEEECLDFHLNKSPAATASAAQVRQPIYKGSMGLWRRYETQLEPLRVRLEDAGIEVS